MKSVPVKHGQKFDDHGLKNKNQGGNLLHNITSHNNIYY